MFRSIQPEDYLEDQFVGGSHNESTLVRMSDPNQYHSDQNYGQNQFNSLPNQFYSGYSGENGYYQDHQNQDLGSEDHYNQGHDY